MVWAFKMEEEVGFEPTVRSHVRRFSRPLQSTALALLQSYSIGYKIYITQNIFVCKGVLVIILKLIWACPCLNIYAILSYEGIK